MDQSDKQYDKETFCADCEEGYCKIHGVNLIERRAKLLDSEGKNTQAIIERCQLNQEDENGTEKKSM